eukprot:2701068-Ditylum_brightwellii.AAC.1
MVGQWGWDTALYLWNKCSEKEILKKHHNKKAYKGFYNRHMKSLKEAFEEGTFEVRYKSGVGFGVYTFSSLSPKKQEDKKAVKLLW